MSAVTDEVRVFIQAHISSIEQLEVLLLLYREGDRSWTAVTVARELRLHVDSVATRLADLTARGLLDTNADGYRFSRDASIGTVVSQLARAYSEARVSVINLIFAKPVDTLRSFADAFKFRGGGKS